MNPVIWFFVGASLGWLAYAELASAEPRDRIVNVITGASGALCAGWLLSSALWPDALDAGEISIAGLIEAAFGAVLSLALVNLVRLLRAP